MNKFQNSYTILDWDSKLFGYTVAKISDPLTGVELKKHIDFLKERQVQLIYIIADPMNTPLNKDIVRLGGKLVDIKRIYSKKIDSHDTDISECSSISSYEDKKTNQTLLSLAYQSGIHSRYYTDKNFTHNEYHKLYSKWIEKAVSRRSAYDVLVYRNEDDSIGGFITLEKNGTKGSVGLLAVDHSLRRKQIGSKLLLCAQYSSNKHHIKTLSITTQKANVPACQLYEKHGFDVVSEQNIYHVWI